MYSSIIWLKSENAFKPIFTVWTILSAKPFDWGWHEVVLYGIYPTFLNHDIKLSSQNSGALSETMVLNIPFLANIILNICLTVVAFSSPPLLLLTNLRRNLLRYKINRCLGYVNGPFGPLSMASHLWATYVFWFV